MPCSPVHVLARLLLLSSSMPVAAATELVEARHGTAEIRLLASRTYDGALGSPNPFTDVTFVLNVTSPTGRSIAVPGFFDGDGLGGQAGNVFVARIYTHELGTWSWVSSSSDPGLHARSGSFVVSGTLPGRWGRGALVARASVPRHFTHQDGTPLFLAGKFLDDAATGKSQRSHPMFSETWTDADRQALLNRASSLSLDKVAVYLANVGDYDAQPTTPWLGSAASSDKTRFDLARWRIYDQWTRAMRDQGYAVQLWLFADDSGFGDLSVSDRERLIGYAMARLSAYANTFFVLALEWDEGWTPSEVDAHATFLQSRNPWRTAGERARHGRGVRLPPPSLGHVHGHPERLVPDPLRHARHEPPELEPGPEALRGRGADLRPREPGEPAEDLGGVHGGRGHPRHGGRFSRPHDPRGAARSRTPGPGRRPGACG